MKMHHVALGFLVIMCFITAFPTSALNDSITTHTENFTGTGTGPGHGLDRCLDHLEKDGFDVSAIRAAVNSGDMTTAHTLMKQFMEANKDKFPARPDFQPGNGVDDSTRMNQHLDRLDKDGFDASAIRAAVNSGDMTTAHTLMKQFMEANRNKFPAMHRSGGQKPSNRRL
jgi:hypothetical protein